MGEYELYIWFNSLNLSKIIKAFKAKIVIISWELYLSTQSLLWQWKRIIICYIVTMKKNNYVILWHWKRIIICYIVTMKENYNMLYCDNERELLHVILWQWKRISSC